MKYVAILAVGACLTAIALVGLACLYALVVLIAAFVAAIANSRRKPMPTVTITRPYWVLFARDKGVWKAQFGDYDRKEVEAEREEWKRTHRAKDLAIERCGPKQDDIDLRCSQLNAKGA